MFVELVEECPEAKETAGQRSTQAAVGNPPSETGEQHSIVAEAEIERLESLEAEVVERQLLAVLEGELENVDTHVVEAYSEELPMPVSAEGRLRRASSVVLGAL